MSLKQVAAAVALLGGSCAVWSLDLTQAYQLALEQDATIRASRASADSGRERLPQAFSQLLPNLSASSVRNTNRLTSTQPGFDGPVTQQDKYFSSNQALTLRQPLYRPYQWALYQQAKAQVDDTNASLDKDLQNVAVRVGGAYLEALLAEDQLKLILSQQVAYTTQLDAARKGLIAGSGIRTDVDDAQARLDMAMAQELEARQNVDYTRKQIQVLTNQPVDFLAGLDAEKMPLLGPNPQALDDWFERAEQFSPEIRSAKAQLEVAIREVEKAKSGHYPTLDAVVQWTRSTSENVISPRSQYDDKTVGFQLSVPIFGGGYVSSQVRQALADQERAEQALEALRRDLNSRVYSQYRGVTEGVSKIRALEQAVRSAETALMSSQKAFQAGSRTRVDILNAEQQRVTATRDLAQARYIYLVSRIRLQALVGNADYQTMAETNAWLKH